MSKDKRLSEFYESIQTMLGAKNMKYDVLRSAIDFKFPIEV